MSAQLPFQVTVFNKAYQRKGPLGAPQRMSGEVVYNGAGSCEFTIPADHPRLADLAASGARVVVRYQPDSDVDLFMLSGRVEEVAGGGPKYAPWRRFQVIDDWSVLSDEIQCWPYPTGTLADQSSAPATAYYIASGPAETVLLNMLAPNVTRQGTTLTLPASLGRGTTIRVLMRYHMADRIIPLVDEAGLGVRVRQSGTTRALEVFVPPTVAQTLTQESGVVVDGEYSVAAPTVTRVVLGANGEGKSRVLRESINASRESTWGVKLPMFIDARDLDSADVDFEAQATGRMNEALAEGASKASLKAVLAETGWFRLGKAYDVGSQVNVSLASGPVVTERIRRVQFSWQPGSAVQITPLVGEWSDVADVRLIKQVQALTRAVGDLEKR